MIDLRSDTLTLPDQEMLKTILGAKLGDDGRTHGLQRGEDLTVNELEDLAAQMTGKEAGVLFPTGTLGNTAAVLAYCQPGDKVLVDEQQHLYISEKVLFDPGFGQLQPVSYRHDENGFPVLEDIEAALKGGGIRLVCIENTHNFTGGACIPLENMKEIYDLAHQYQVPVHMDGARMFNAAVALNVSAGEMCRYVDSVMFCVSKGLGAPVGSLVCSNQEFTLKVREKRKLLGGVMRQAGIIAAPGLYAMKNHIERLQEDHDHAKCTAELIQGLKHTHMVGQAVTNILVLDVNDLGLTPEEYCQKAEEKGLLIKPVLSDKVRLVFYKGITKEDAIEAARIIRSLDNE
ncbi:MAG: GntG family PLP-dependent aldolase [Lacrimispora sp.]|uniref:threonine aldolase family protein n=1 Tax=Lacrimispora sp. TaxID=2719234 RepID=UPI0039E5A696